MSALAICNHEEQEYQYTLKKPVTIQGKAAFINEQAQITIVPADPNTGIIFQIGKRAIPATARFLYEDPCFPHTTVLQKDGVKAITVEHLLSTFIGLGVSNAVVLTLENGQIPFGDGSSSEFCDKILEVGLEQQEESIKKICIQKTLEIRLGDSLIKIFPATNASLQIDACIECDSPIGVQQMVYIHSSNKFCLNISRARTFAFSHFKSKKYTREKLPGFYYENDKFSDSNMIIHNPNKYLVGLRFSDEAIRNKILDFLGDIALLGVKIQGFFLLHRPGHRLNHILVKKIWSCLCQNPFPA